jgi:hypothetical protein
MIFPILLIFGAYSISSYGVVLVKGWNITASEWINPVAGFAWPTDGSAPLCVPPGQLFPSKSATGVQCGSASSGGNGTTQNPTGPQIGGTSGVSKPKKGKCPPGNTYNPVTGDCQGPATI